MSVTTRKPTRRELVALTKTLGLAVDSRLLDEAQASDDPEAFIRQQARHVSRSTVAPSDAPVSISSTAPLVDSPLPKGEGEHAQPRLPPESCCSPAAGPIEPSDVQISFDAPEACNQARPGDRLSALIRGYLAPLPDHGYRSRRLDLKLDQHQADVLCALARGLNQANVRLQGGRHVDGSADAVRWLLELLGQ